jgi:hypothetical protein
MVAILVGCRDAVDREQPSTPANTSPTAPAPSAFGRIVSVDEAARLLTVRSVVFFGEGAADQAACEDGVIGPGETLPNPSTSETWRRRPPSLSRRNVRVTLLGYDVHGSPTPLEVSFPKFARVVNSGEYAGRWYGTASNVYHLRIHEGDVLGIRQINTP